MKLGMLDFDKVCQPQAKAVSCELIKQACHEFF